MRSTQNTSRRSIRQDGKHANLGLFRAHCSGTGNAVHQFADDVCSRRPWWWRRWTRGGRWISWRWWRWLPWRRCGTHSVDESRGAALHGKAADRGTPGNAAFDSRAPVNGRSPASRGAPQRWGPARGAPVARVRRRTYGDHPPIDFGLEQLSRHAGAVGWCRGARLRSNGRCADVPPFSQSVTITRQR